MYFRHEDGVITMAAVNTSKRWGRNNGIMKPIFDIARCHLKNIPLHLPPNAPEGVNDRATPLSAITEHGRTDRPNGHPDGPVLDHSKVGKDICPPTRGCI
ncbi:hypothetical protein JTE90_014429 [Oedothorax gibbosus]|uniref:Uncharacterized protein n=1 Tax=Oedothorax gibbosus TaxID=931172 RepID=A0AAV6V382_9ARAC|nr:hypothetical protein JTE90_014429 [Oedothorax gibbosus]